MSTTSKSKMEKVGKLYGMMPFYKRFYLKDKDSDTIVSHNGEPIEYIFTEDGLREKIILELIY